MEIISTMINMNEWPSPDKERLYEYLRWNSYRSERYKLLYVATPKVACTSLKWWFAALEGRSQVLRGITDSAETDPDLVIHDTFHKVAPNVTGLMPQALSEALTSDSYFRFAVVRNPYKRIFSAWQSKLLLREPIQIGPYSQCDFFRRPIECTEDVAAAFEGFLEHLATNEAPSYWDAHWTPQATLLRPDLIKYSKLVQIENAKELSQALAEHLGGYIPDPFANRHTNESLIPYLPKYITERSSELIRTLYAADFDTFGYDKQLPEAKETFSDDQLDLALKAVALIRGRHQRLGERIGQVTNLNQTIASINQVIVQRDQKIARLDQTVNSMLGSLSWRLTRPLRFAGAQYVRLNKKFESVTSIAIRFWGRIRRVVGKAIGVYQNEGVGGVRRVLLNFPAYLMPRRPGSIWSRRGLADNKPDGAQTGGNQPDTEFVAYQKNPPINPLVKLIAFYLPQFHPFPENDLWWGKGFTEWTNVGKAQPNYVGHYQPHCPIHLGYYDLRVPEVMEEQAKLAKEYGIYGFSYYFYWFGGKILMDLPLETMLGNKKMGMPFCLTWANENWSRRWDGQDNDILIAQKHSDEDSLAFIRHLVKYFKDERYIRIDGKPVLIIYRANIIPNIVATAQIWREEVLKHGFSGLYLVSAQSFGIKSPTDFGFDASVEFPPHNIQSADIGSQLELINPKFCGRIRSYQQCVATALLQLSNEPDYKLFRTAMLTWDNTARKQNQGSIWHGFSLSLYKKWLSSIIGKVLSNQKYSTDEKIVFVNAWNEWAEGTHLEPDQKFGYGYLQTTYDVLRESIGQPHKIIIVTHDAFPSGAQYLALHMAREFTQGFGFHVEIVCLSGGILKEQYSQYAEVHDLTGSDHRGAAAHELAKNMAASGHRLAIVNTTVSGFFLETLKAHGIQCISLIHELRGVIDQYNLYEQAKVIAKLADKVVFAARQVADQFQEIAPVQDVQRVLRPQGLYKKNGLIHKRNFARQELRKILHLPADALIVLCVGYASHRKGIDLFVDAGKKLVSRLPMVYCVWIGHWHDEMRVVVDASLAKSAEKKSHFIFTGLREDTDLFYTGADVFALTSREDPFPSVVLEAMNASLPVVGFEGIGGCTELLAAGCGKLVKAFDTDAFSSALEEILQNRDMADHMGLAGKIQIRERFSFRNYLFDLLKLIEYPLPRVSVVVPNYNYAHYLVERIKSIEKQTFPVYELIIIDDCSSDDSVQVIEKIIQDSPLDIKFVRNATNSGSVFAQWQKGVELATGDLIWIAEADDLSQPDFLITVLQGFNHADVALSYCESQQIDQNGKVLRDNYLGYVAAVGQERWLKPYVRTGREEIVDALSIKNTIPNVSAVVFRRNILGEVLKREQNHILEFTVAGDWYIYTKVLERGGIAFTPHAANVHRRHAKSVTNTSRNFSQLAEIVHMQRLVASAYPVTEDTRKTARQHAQKIYEKLGLASGEFPNFEQALASREEIQ